MTSRTMADFSALLVFAVRTRPEMFAETKHIIATSSWVQDKVMPYVVNRRMDIHEQWLPPLPPRSNEGRLYRAVLADKTARVRELLWYGANTRALDNYGLTPLQHAGQIRRVSADTIRALVEADPEGVCLQNTRDGKTALCYALELHRGAICPEHVETMVGAAPESLDIADHTGRTPRMMIAAWPERVKSQYPSIVGFH